MTPAERSAWESTADTGSWHEVPPRVLTWSDVTVILWTLVLAALVIFVLGRMGLALLGYR